MPGVCYNKHNETIIVNKNNIELVKNYNFGKNSKLVFTENNIHINNINTIDDIKRVFDVDISDMTIRHICELANISILPEYINFIELDIINNKFYISSINSSAGYYIQYLSGMFDSLVSVVLIDNIIFNNNFSNNVYNNVTEVTLWNCLYNKLINFKKIFPNCYKLNISYNLYITYNSYNLKFTDIENITNLSMLSCNMLNIECLSVFQNLEYLLLPMSYDEPIDALISLKKLKSISFGFLFNKSLYILSVLPKLKSVKVGLKFDKLCTLYSSSLEELYILNQYISNLESIICMPNIKLLFTYTSIISDKVDNWIRKNNILFIQF